MQVGIDSSNGLRYVGMVSGVFNEIDSLYKNISMLFSARNIKPPFHWSELTSKDRFSLRPAFVALINNSMLKFNILCTQHRMGEEKKTFFLKRVPEELSNHLIPVIHNTRKDWICDIRLDKDYNIGGVKNPNKVFLENFLINLAKNIRAERIPIINGKNDSLKMEFKNSQNSNVTFYAHVFRSSDSKEIQIIDLTMGFYLQNHKGFDMQRVHFRDIDKKPFKFDKNRCLPPTTGEEWSLSNTHQATSARDHTC